MSASDMQFGELEETQPESCLRPDQDLHFGVVACGSPGLAELPIYVDLDAMRDIEEHAVSDTRVELGGVLLGGQYLDDQGRPFVVVRDCLRAEHYEATKGSFKFTHETWEQITRQREAFAPEWQMVGWYHTHPDWGVFLSGMDMFICDHFFNRPLDVALVVDPCRDDRGWFQWTGEPEERVRRTSGFFLIASRFRLDELEAHAATYHEPLAEEDASMAWAARSSRSSGAANPAAPVVHIHERSTSAATYVLAGMLLVQCLFLGGLALLMLNPADPAGASVAEPGSGELRREAEVWQLQNEVQRQLLEELARTQAGQGRDWVERLQTAEVENVRLRSSLDAQIAAAETLRAERDQLQDSVTATKQRAAELDRLASQQRKELKSLDSELEALLETTETQTADPAGVSSWSTVRDWRLWASGLILLALGGAGGVAAGMLYQRKRLEDWFDRQDAVEPSERAAGFSIRDADDETGESLSDRQQT